MLFADLVCGIYPVGSSNYFVILFSRHESMHLLMNLYVLVYEISRSLVVLPVIASSGNFKLNVIRGSTDVDTAFCGYNNRFVSTATKDCD